MANRYFFRDQQAYLRGITELPVVANIGATGAITSTVPTTPRGYTIARTGVGTYVVTLTDPFPAVIDVSADVALVNGTASASNPCWPTPGPFTAANGATKATQTVYVWNPGGTALQDPPSGAVLYVTMAFLNTTVP